jgi:hypothetical protein
MMIKICDCIDYPTSRIFQEFFMELEGEHLPLIKTDNDTSESYFENPKIISVLEKMVGVIGIYNEPKLKGPHL